jgi:hypothetical protein
LGVLAFCFGTAIAMSCGAWVYRRINPPQPQHQRRPALAALASGIVTSFIAAATYIPTHVSEWLSPGSDWRMSVFMAVCFGIIQGALFRSGSLQDRTLHDS